MPSEHRQITFSLDEITRAVTDMMAHHGVLPVHSQITGLRITEVGEQVGAMVTVVTNETNKVRELPLTADLLGAALIRLCRDARIPLPKFAKKRLVCSGDGLAMHLNISGAPTNAVKAHAAQREPAPTTASHGAAAHPATAPSAAAKPKTSAPPADPALPDYWSAMSRRGR